MDAILSLKDYLLIWIPRTICFIFVCFIPKAHGILTIGVYAGWLPASSFLLGPSHKSKPPEPWLPLGSLRPLGAPGRKTESTKGLFPHAEVLENWPGQGKLELRGSWCIVSLKRVNLSLILLILWFFFFFYVYFLDNYTPFGYTSIFSIASTLFWYNYYFYLFSVLSKMFFFHFFQDGLKLAKEIAKIHYENKDVHLARDAMETAFRKYPSYVTPEDVNLMLEVLMHQQEYTKCIEILINHAGVQLLNKVKFNWSMFSIHFPFFIYNYFCSIILIFIFLRWLIWRFLGKLADFYLLINNFVQEWKMKFWF